ncbi:hypothetical protein D3C84_768030 [compost metagenome]
MMRTPALDQTSRSRSSAPPPLSAAASSSRAALVRSCRRHADSTRLATGRPASSAWASPRVSAANCERGSPSTGRRQSTRSTAANSCVARAGSRPRRLSRGMDVAVSCSQARRRGPPAADAELVSAAHCADSVLRRLAFATIGPSSCSSAFCSELASPAARNRPLRSAMSSVIERAMREGRPVSWQRAEYSTGSRLFK